MTTAVRAVRVVAAASLAVAVAVSGQVGPAHGVTAVEAGWWTASPLLVAPDAPPGALVVEGGLAGALAYGAVRFTLTPDEAPEALTVRLAPGAASTPGTTLALCPLTEPFTPVHGGSMADAPAFDCETAQVEAPPPDDGEPYVFDVSGLAVAGALAVAVLPTAPTDRVVLSPPGAESLATSGPGVDPPGSDGPPAGGSSSGDIAGPTTPSTASSGSGAVRTPRPVAGAPAAPTRPAPGAAVPAPVAAAPPVAATPAARDQGSSGGSWLPPAVFVGLAVLAAALWFGTRAADEDVTDLENAVLSS